MSARVVRAAMLPCGLDSGGGPAPLSKLPDDTGDVRGGGQWAYLVLRCLRYM